MANITITPLGEGGKIRVGNSKVKLENNEQNKISVKLVLSTNIIDDNKKLGGTKTISIEAGKSAEVDFGIKFKDKHTGGDIKIDYDKTSFNDILYPTTGDPRFEFLYWSGVEKIDTLSAEESKRTSSLCKNEDGFLHIKALGFYNKNANIRLEYRKDGNNILLCDNSVSLYENSKTIAIYATEVLDFLKRREEQIEEVEELVETKKEGSVFSKIAIATALFPFATPIVAAVAAAKYFWGDKQEKQEEKKEITGIYATVTVEGEHVKTEAIELKENEDAEKPTESVFSIGRVLVEVAEENCDNEDTKPQNLIVGSITNIEGTGKAGTTYSEYRMQTYNIYLFDFLRLEKIKEDDIKDYKNTVDDRKAIYSLLKAIVAKTNNELKTTELQALLGEAKKRRRPFWDHYICRDAWQSVDYRLDAVRYGSNQECPPGPRYIIPYAGSKYTMYVSQDGNSSWLSKGETRDGVEFKNFAGRGGIAFHKGDATWSLGCLTLNINDIYRNPSYPFRILFFTFRFIYILYNYHVRKVQDFHLYIS